MGWEQQMFTLLDEMEGQAESLFAEQRALEVAERARAEYAGVSVASRLVASLGSQIEVDVRGLGRLRGLLQRAGADWFLVTTSGPGARWPVDWVLRLEHVVAVRGASDRSVPKAAWGALSRLSVSSALRRIAESGEQAHLHLVDGTRREAVLGRVGSDFVEARGVDGVVELVPLPALVAISSHER